MASPAAVLSVLVQAEGIARTNSQLRGLQGGLTQSSKAAGKIGTDLDKGSKTGTRALSGLKSAAGLAGVALGAAGIAGAMKSAIGEFQEARKVGANTNQVIKTTGGVANVSAKQVAALATSISKKAGIDDEAIQSGANLLLTFKNIRNETGKGRDIFNQATKAAVDLSAAGFGSLSSTSKQLGKALNDPVKGITALARSGVTFTNKQKILIGELIHTGKAVDRVKAQQIVLGEVQSQVGGQAAAQATTMDHLKVTLGNLAEAAGSVLVPALDKIGKFLNTVINQMIEGKSVGGAVVSTFKTLGLTAIDLGTAIAGLVGWFKQHQTIAVALAAAIGVFALAYTASLIPALIATTAAVYAQVAGWVALKIAFLTSPIGLIVTGLAALAAAVVVAYRESETFRNIVNAAWDVIKAVASWLIAAGGPAFTALATAVTTAWGVIKTVTETVWNGLKAFLVPLWGVLQTLITTYFGAYKTIITGVWNAIQTVTTTVWGVIKGILVGVWGALKTAATALFGALKTVIVGEWNAIKTAATTVWGLVNAAILGPIRAVRDALGGKDGIWARIHESAVNAWDKIKGALAGFAKGVKDGVLDAIKGGLNLLIGFVNAVIKVINAIPGVPNIKPIAKLAEGGVVGGGGGGPNGNGRLANGGLVGLAKGALVQGTGSGDKVPLHVGGRLAAMVEPGEFVSVANRNATAALMDVNSRIPRFAAGGNLNTQEMSDLWRSKGGSATLADTMGVIGLVESGGNPNARNPSGASGLWQILGQLVPGNIFNPGINALNAIAKYKSQGLSAWDASKSKWGPLIGKTVGPDLNPLNLIKKLPGLGDLPEWLKGTGKWLLDHVGDWIKKTVASVVPGSGATASGPSGVGTFEGVSMANWVIGALKHARAKGFTGHPTSGYRTHAENVAQGRLYRSEHEGIRYPHGAVDFGGFHSGLATKLAFVNAVSDYKYPLLAPIGFTDDGHASGTGHRMGGVLGQGAPFVGSFRTGGRVPADGFGYLHQGETVVPRGAGGPLVHVEHMEVRNDMDLDRWARKLGWQLAAGGA